MLANPQIARMTAAKKRVVSHHGMWITTILSRLPYSATQPGELKPAAGPGSRRYSAGRLSGGTNRAAPAARTATAAHVANSDR
jgi:hypothetical protein